MSSAESIPPRRPPSPARRLAPIPPGHPDVLLVRALRARDEDAYLTLVRRYTPLMLRIARGHVGRAAAEDVVQDTWLAVVRNIDSFEARSSFKTWLMRILVNTARTRATRDGRTVCLGALPEEVDVWAGAEHRPRIAPDPERHALDGETWQVVDRALATLPPRQRTVVELRDVAGWGAEDVCRALGISAGNQRLLLHRGRIRMRNLLAPHLAPARPHLRLHH